MVNDEELSEDTSKPTCKKSTKPTSEGDSEIIDNTNTKESEQGENNGVNDSSSNVSTKESEQKDDDLNKEFAEIHEVIEKELEERRTKVRGAFSKFSKEKSPEVTGSSGSGSGSDTDSEKEMEEANKFIQEETMNLIGECINTRLPSQAKLDSLLMPPPSSTPARSFMEKGF